MEKTLAAMSFDWNAKIVVYLRRHDVLWSTEVHHWYVYRMDVIAFMVGPVQRFSSP